MTDQKMMKRVPLTIWSCEEEGICITSASATAPRSPAPNILQRTQRAQAQSHVSPKAESKHDGLKSIADGEMAEMALQGRT